MNRAERRRQAKHHHAPALSPRTRSLKTLLNEAVAHHREGRLQRNEPKIREFLRSRGANAVAIPYRQDRAVVFNSDLFHETDRLAFKDEYASRRINVTLLYGYRFAS